MAMSVAEKPVAERAPRSPHAELALASVLGAVYVLASLWFVFGGFPLLWSEFFPPGNPFLSIALLLIATAGIGFGLWYVGYTLEKHSARRGLRAGVFVAAVLIYLIAWLCLSVIGPFLEEPIGGMGGAVITVLLGAGMAVGAIVLFLKPGFAAWLGRLEDRGWFHALPYKPTQGVRVRRATVLGILVVGLCGIYVLVTHHSLGYEIEGGRPNNWEWTIPFSKDLMGAEYVIPLMFKVHLVMPLLLFVGLLWVAWRVVNWPTFADFLIATEAEMNKVSWTTRKRLWQDTVVVLVTVFLLTAYLFVIDIGWIKVLGWVNVLQVDVKAEQLKQQEKSQW
jgi:preprotein translocase SecE subunit